MARRGPDDHVVLVGGKPPLREKHDDMADKTRAAGRVQSGPRRRGTAGRAPLTFHSLLATYATICADAGLPIGEPFALLGHADAATTAIYIRTESSRAASTPEPSWVARFWHCSPRSATASRIDESFRAAARV